MKHSLDGDGSLCVFKDVAEEGVCGDRSSHKIGGWGGSRVVETLGLV